MKTSLHRLCFALLTLPLGVATAAPADPMPARFRNQLGMEFVLIPAGPFRFGYSASDGQAAEALQADQIVWLRQPYYLQTTEVTQGQWQSLMGRSPCVDSCQTPGPDYPVQGVQISEISTFIQRLNQSESKAYRLPTRPEWEHAARAGSWRTRYWWGDDPRLLTQSDNCRAPGDALPWPGLARDGYAGLAPVASFQPNPWGLYDMQGNVSELLGHATLLWSGYRLDPTHHFRDDPHRYLQAYTDFPRDSLPDYPYRDAAGGNYRVSAAGCQLSSGSGLLLDTPGAALDSGNTRSETVGFRLLLPATAVSAD